MDKIVRKIVWLWVLSRLELITHVRFTNLYWFPMP